jgi:hypothetical protein
MTYRRLGCYLIVIEDADIILCAARCSLLLTVFMFIQRETARGILDTQNHGFIFLFYRF